MHSVWWRVFFEYSYVECCMLCILLEKNFKPLTEWVSVYSVTVAKLNITGGNNIPMFFCGWYETVGWLIWKLNLSNLPKKKHKWNLPKEWSGQKRPSVTWFGHGKVNWTANKHKKTSILRSCTHTRHKPHTHSHWITIKRNVTIAAMTMYICV